MAKVTFNGGGIFAGIATMLELLGYPTTDREIALGIEAPYLFVRDEHGFQAGTKLGHPQWLNLYLHPRGLHLTYELLASKDVPAYLRAHSPAMLRIVVQRNVVHPAVFSHYADGKYHFFNIKPDNSTEPDSFAISSTSLKRRLDAEVTVYTIVNFPPETVDFIPLLYASLQNLETWKDEVLALRQRDIDYAEFSALREPLFRAMTQDILSVTTLTEDHVLFEALRQLNHYYRHISASISSEPGFLAQRLPKRTIIQCVEWLKENILDRLSELGVEDADLEQLLHGENRYR